MYNNGPASLGVNQANNGEPQMKDQKSSLDDNSDKEYSIQASFPDDDFPLTVSQVTTNDPDPFQQHDGWEWGDSLPPSLLVNSALPPIGRGGSYLQQNSPSSAQALAAAAAASDSNTETSSNDFTDWSLTTWA